MKRIALALGMALLLVVAARWTSYAQQDDPRFTGKSDTMDAKDLGIGRRGFEAGARSAWHSHDKGQLIFVEQGRARTQKKGQPMKELRTGDSDYTPPNVVHWHGAVPNERFVQVAVSFGGEIKWLEKTTDDEYNGKK
jgi:quercetin dioxygenase-like cupin family protein